MSGPCKRNISQLTVLKTLLVLICITFVIYWRRDCKCPEIKEKEVLDKIKEVFICMEDDSSKNLSGLERVEYLTRNSLKDGTPLNEESCRRKVVSVENTKLLYYETESYKRCVEKYELDFKEAHTDFWTENNQYIRHSHHTYLDSNSVIFDIGGNVGEDAKEFIDKYKPRRYLILEPLTVLYKNLKKKFKDNENVVIYNLGVGLRNKVLMENIEGNEGDATSEFMESKRVGTCPLRIVNATELLIRLGIGCLEVDLLTINCEGCEFEFIEALLSTNLVNYFKNIQFATHTRLKHLSNPIQRYCEIQQRLSRTHRLTYQYKFNWENWRRLV